MAATWQVVEKMESKGQALFLFKSSTETKVAFGEPGATDLDYIIEKSITLAICKAALVVTTQRAETGFVAA
jgi:hypothetical protein